MALTTPNEKIRKDNIACFSVYTINSINPNWWCGVCYVFRFLQAHQVQLSF